MAGLMMSEPSVVSASMARSSRYQDVAYLLHSRNFTDSRYILEFFTQQYGRLKAVYRPVKRKSGLIAKPQPFTPLTLEFYGDGELKTLRSLEISGNPILTTGLSLFCGMYLNELLQKLLPLEVEFAGLFQVYSNSLVHLVHAQSGEEDIALRVFEFELLSSLGYGIGFQYDSLGDEIVAGTGRTYCYFPSEGFVPQHGPVNSASLLCVGDTLAAIADADWYQPQVRQLAKQICRRALHEVLGGQELKSRELFR